MPDLDPALSMLVSAARYAVIAYAAVATILTTACLTLQAITAWDRRFTRRAAPQRARRRGPRPLFLRLETGTDEA
jgi:hypothetical protein